MTTPDPATAAHAEVARLDRFFWKLSAMGHRVLDEQPGGLRGRERNLRRTRLFLAGMEATRDECRRATDAYRDAIARGTDLDARSQRSISDRLFHEAFEARE